MQSIAEAAPALRAAGLVGVWNTDVVAGKSILDAGAAALLAGNIGLAGRPIPLEVALGATHPDDKAWLFARIRRVRQMGGVFSAEFRVVTATGDVRWVLNRGTLAPDTSGAMKGLGAYIDTTDSHNTRFVSAGSLAQVGEDPLAHAADRCLETHSALAAGGYTNLRRITETLLLGIGRALAQRHT
ncbi:diguanylate cyclase [Methylobacterium sp. Leaf113]|uniref:PAS domain-containing protein n=1 Tax=unclassified Methylobacterium TaxID=2615210 RepID=UPI0007000DD5|nr:MULTISPECIES: PAS domain-containing protein [unclassified Methylobacterium]KQP79271.1 diguanylate cyclase [Methylobacterium sp. Leaf117]KQP88921.1 diguanylate cyclase [Methylobacterium sp. Leaf113]